MKQSRILLLLVALSGLAMADRRPGYGVAAQTTADVPELNPNYALTALTLFSGTLVVIRSRRKR